MPMVGCNSSVLTPFWLVLEKLMLELVILEGSWFGKVKNLLGRSTRHVASDNKFNSLGPKIMEGPGIWADLES